MTLKFDFRFIDSFGKEGPTRSTAQHKRHSHPQIRENKFDIKNYKPISLNFTLVKITFYIKQMFTFLMK